eukprot:4943-Heterococcus_DN1.PRE.3
MLVCLSALKLLLGKVVFGDEETSAACEAAMKIMMRYAKNEKIAVAACSTAGRLRRSGSVELSSDEAKVLVHIMNNAPSGKRVGSPWHCSETLRSSERFQAAQHLSGPHPSKSDKHDRVVFASSGLLNVDRCQCNKMINAAACLFVPMLSADVFSRIILNYPSSISVQINEHACTIKQNYDCKRFVSYPSNKLCVCASHLRQDAVITCQLTRQALY